MGQYYYKGRDMGGKLVEGIVQAASEVAVASQLIRSGTNPILITEQVTKEDVLKILSYRLQIGTPGLQDLAFFSRQMYSLTRAGIPLIRGIRVVEESTKNPFLKSALIDVIRGIESGQALGISMARHPLIFPELMITLVNVGENTGGLDKVFQQMAFYLERELETRNRIKMALRYPIFVLCVVAIAIAIINLFVIPAFSAFFSKFSAQLPIYTRILIGVSNFSVQYWPILLLLLVSLIVGWVLFLKSKSGRYIWDKVKLKIPLVGIIILHSLLSRFARTFSLCIRTGLPLLQSISLIAKSTDNVYVEEKIMKMQVNIEHGESVTKATTHTNMFSPLVIQMISIGEETGEMDRLLEEVSNYYDQEVDYKIKRLGDAIEPILLVVLGGIVLILALGIYLPLWDLSQVISGKG